MSSTITKFFASFLAYGVANKKKRFSAIGRFSADYIFPSVIQGIDQVMTENGYSIILKNTKNSSSAEGKCLEELLSKDIEGLIIEPSKSEIYCRHIALYKKLDEFHIPYVFIQGTMEQLSDRPYVMMDDFKGGYLITKYLLSLGHRKILGMFKADDRHESFQFLCEVMLPGHRYNYYTGWCGLYDGLLLYVNNTTSKDELNDLLKIDVVRH